MAVQGTCTTVSVLHYLHYNTHSLTLQVCPPKGDVMRSCSQSGSSGCAPSFIARLNAERPAGRDISNRAASYCRRISCADS